MRLLAAVFLCAFTAAGPAAAIEPDYTETDILKVLDRRPLEVEFFDAAAQGSDIYLATSGGLLQVNLSERRAKKIIREPVTAAAWDGERIVAAGAGGVWREDLGWVRPVGFDPSVLRVSSMQLAGGVLLVSRTDLWKLSGSRSVHLYYDSAGLAGAPAASTDEIAVLGFWALHKIGFSGADAAEINVQDIPLPPALRADVPLGVAYVDRTILAIGRRTGVHLLPPGASEFSGLIPPPPLAEAHLQAGFPEGWVDFAVVEGRIYLMLADAALYTLDPARSPAVLHRVSRWPDPAQPFQFEVLPAAAARGDLSRHILLFPFSGNFVLDADLTDNLPKKWNFVTTPLGEILVREGLPPKQFGAAGLVFSLWGSLVVVLLLLLIVFAARIFRRRFSGTTAAMALCAGLLLQACGAPRDIPPPSVSVPVAPVAETDTETQLRDTLSQAIEAAESILKISPADADALLAAALAAEHLGRLDIAVRYYARLQEVTRETAHLQKLAELTRLSDPAAAYQYAIRFFEGGGSDDRLRFWLIQQHANRQNVSQAYALTEFLTPPPDQFAAGFLRDLCLQYALSLPSAAPDALTALRRATRFAPLPSHLAETAALGFLNAGDARAAEEMLKPFPGPAHVLRARIAESLGNAPDALSQRLKYFRAGGRDPRELLVLLDALGRADPARGVAEALWSANRDLDPRMRIQIARRLARFYRESPSPDTAAEIGFLEELRPLNDPLFLDRLAELQRAVGNAREALSILQTRYPDGVPKDKIDFYVSQALSAGEIQEALRAAEAAPQAVSAPIRLRLADILNRSAEESMSAGEWDKASAAAQRAARLAVDPRNHKTFARISLRQSDTPAALRYLSAALKDAPGDPVANFMKGMILVSQGKWSEAKAPLEIAHAARHPDDRVTLLLGRALFSLGLFDRAFSALQEYAVIRNQQVDPPVQELTGRAALSAGRPAEAAAWFERRLVSGADEKISAALLDALIASGQKAKALGAAREMVVRHPAARPILESAVGVFDLATDSPMLLRTLESLSSLTSEPDRKIAILRRLLDVKLQMGRAAEADAILTTLLSKFPNDPQLLTEAWKLRKGTSAVEPILKRLAVIRSPGDPIQLIHARRLMEDGRLDDSLRVVRAYGTVQKTDAAALALESEIWIGKKRPDEAARVYRALLAIRRDETARRWLVNHIHDQVLSAVASGKPLPGAGPLYRETLDLLGSEEKIQDLFELFGKLFDRAGDRTLAIDALRREFRNTTDVSKRMRLAERLGDWYYRDAQLSLAREMYVSAREAGNRSPDFLRNFSGLLERLGESDEAASLHAEILKNFPYDRDANLFLARRATAQGRREEALKFLESLRAASPADSAVLTAIGGAYAGLGRHDQAAGVWRSLRDLTGDPKFLSKYADALYESGQHQKALLEYRELFTYGVADPEQLRRLAALEQNQGSWDQAERILLKLLRTGGTAKDREKLSELLRKMGDLAVQRGNAAEAAQIAQRLLDLRENDPASFVLMGRSKLLQGKFPEAVESFSRAISLAPGDARPLVGLAAAELRRQRPVAAVEYARMAIARDPSLPEAYSILGQAYQRQGKVSEAYAALKSALQNSQNRAGAHIRMGDLFLQHAKYNVALEQFRRAIEIDPRNARARERYAFTLYRLGFSENAMKELLKAIEIDPEGAGSEATALLADIFVAHDEPDRARDLLESVAAKRQAPPGVLIRLGEMYRQNREFSKAVQFFKDALLASEDPRDKYDALNALGMALGDLGDNAAAEKTFREAIGVAPNRPEAFLNLGLVYQDRKEFVPAVDLTRKAIEAAPDRPEGYKLLGLIYYQAGWEEESLSAFRESLKRNPDQPEIAGLVQRIEEPAD